MQEFVDKLKQHLVSKKADLYSMVEVETSFGYTIDYDDFKFDDMLVAIDEFSKQFNGE